MLQNPFTTGRNKKMAEGTVKSFDAQKGFGFITDAAGKEYTFNQNSIADAGAEGLKEGERVSFDIEQGARGSRAVRVKKM
jgi:cold shock protein